MTCDDIIRMAREVADKDKDDPYHAGEPPFIVLTDEELERFAVLIASQERKACAKACYEIAGKGDAFDCMDAIRARGEKE